MMAGVRLTLLLGPTLPTPAPPTIVEALQSAEVTHADDDRSGFSITFQLGRSAAGAPQDYPLLKHPLLQPFSRVRLAVTLQGVPEVLIEGVITRHDFPPSSQAGASTLTVTGEDLGVLMDLREEPHSYPGQGPYAIVQQILGRYTSQGVVAKVIPPKGVTNPSPNEPSTAQQVTDYRFVSALARHYGHVFYFSPSPAGKGSLAYWGPPPRSGLPQRALSTNLGPATNVERLQFGLNALGPERVTGLVLDPATGQTSPVTGARPDGAPLAREGSAPGANTRETRIQASGHTVAEARARAQGQSLAARDALTAEGELDVLCYGGALSARSLVGVRGAGEGHDGLYYVKKVTHMLRRGQYRQRFTLAREGKGSTVPGVRT